MNNLETENIEIFLDNSIFNIYSLLDYNLEILKNIHYTVDNYKKNIIIDKLQNTIDNLKILNYKKYLNKDLNTNQWNNKIYELAISDNIIITNIIEKISSIINNNLNYSNYNSDSNLNYTNYKTIINLNNDSITNELILIIEKLVSEI
jgi:hypothetical protein